jgi:4-hydroxyphenylpyruvate dioxygenase
MKIQNQGFDHVEFSVNDIAPHAEMYERMGFEKIGERSLPKRNLKSALYAQGLTRIMLTQPLNAASSTGEESHRFLKEHDEGICVLALDVDDATRAFEETVKNGARPAMEPKKYESAEGSVVRAEIWTPGDVRYAFIERKAPHGPQSPALFDEGLTASRLESPSPYGIQSIDHLTNNVSMGEMKKWSEWYKKVFGFQVVRTFNNIRTARTGLKSDVVQSPDGKVKVPINEATERESQVQEFVDRMKGPGVQHLALLTSDLPMTLKALRKSRFKFLTVPHTYYEIVPRRVPGVTEDLAELEELGILLDGNGAHGRYLLQIFSEEVVGPFFFEYIQRKGDDGFGEGNFQALFEAIERDQIKRGVLKA